MTKSWSRHEMARHHTESKRLIEISACRDEALTALATASPELYERALDQDETMWPHRWKPMTETPPVPGYDAQKI